MGIKNLSKLLEKICPNSINNFDINDFKNKYVAIDASNILYQYISALRSRGEDLKTKEGLITTHIYAILYRTLDLLKKGMIPIYVFDGKSPEFKNNTLDERHEQKTKITKKLKELVKEEKINIEIYEKQLKELKKDVDQIRITEEFLDKQKEIKNKKGSMMKQTVSLNKEIINECKEVLDLMGIKYIDALEEADTQLAYLSKNNIVDYIISEDMDLLTFGCKNLIRNYSGKKDIKKINLETILNEMELSQEQFIELCILLGCDYIETINSIGYNKAYLYIKKYGNIENIIKENKKLNITDNFKNGYKEIVNYFLKPKIIEIKRDQLKNKEMDKENLLLLLNNKYEFDYDHWAKSLKFSTGGKKIVKKKVVDLFID